MSLDFLCERPFKNLRLEHLRKYEFKQMPVIPFIKNSTGKLKNSHLLEALSRHCLQNKELFLGCMLKRARGKDNEVC